MRKARLGSDARVRSRLCVAIAHRCANAFEATIGWRELLDRHRFRTHKEAEVAIFDFIEGWYNLHRRHAARGYRSPAVFERETAA